MQVMTTVGRSSLRLLQRTMLATSTAPRRRPGASFEPTGTCGLAFPRQTGLSFGSVRDMLPVGKSSTDSRGFMTTASRRFSVLFRYRDLIANTISEHKAILAQKGSCWWGWWKRPTEDGRDDVWEPIKDEIAKNGFVDVGLFDSGATADESAVRIARVTQIVPPERSGAGFVAPSLGAEQQPFIPEYYRRSPFSRAWLRMTSIGEPVAFFGKYSFDKPPPLPQIAPEHLNRLEGKRILDRDELRAMDTTVWHVRESQDTDSSERFLAPGQRLLLPHSRSPIAMVGNAILHLTDLHFAAEPHRKEHYWGYQNDHDPKMVEEIGAAVASKKIGLIVVTGDLTFVGSPDEFKLAGKSLNALLGKFGLGSEQLVVVPGNHDIVWTQAGATYEPGKPVSYDLTAAAKQYREFYRIVMQHEAHPKLSMARRFITPSGVVVDVGGLNTSSLETGKDYLAGMGRTHPTALREVADTLLWNGEPTLALRLLALHHHVTATEDVEDPSEFAKGFGMAIDAKKTLREAAKLGIHLVLHGHRHRAFVWRETVYGLPEDAQDSWSLGDVAILGGGSAGSSEVPNKSNYFNLIDIRSNEVHVDLYRSRECASFAVSRSWRAGLNFHEGRIVLGAWMPTSANG